MGMVTLPASVRAVPNRPAMISSMPMPFCVLITRAGSGHNAAKWATASAKSYPFMPTMIRP